MKMLTLSTLLGGAILTASSLAACDGNVAPPSVPPVPSGEPSTVPSGAPSGAPSAAPSGAPSAAPSAPAAIQMKAPVATQMTAELAAIGLDPKKLPPIEKLEPEKLRKVMKTFTKALGVQCNACHNADDFKAATPNKNVTKHMWNEFSRNLTLGDGSPLYCDSCHQGSMHILDKRDKKELAKWMQAELVDKLKRVDKKEHGCETCHGDPFEGAFIDKVWAKK